MDDSGPEKGMPASGELIKPLQDDLVAGSPLINSLLTTLLAKAFGGTRLMPEPNGNSRREHRVIRRRAPLFRYVRKWCRLRDCKGVGWPLESS